ncbi:hypothetical protein JCM30471_25870 [Desulfuromonas carbonis]|uniref:hypothetical protein n=1 Tax=Desulfuromonas sp. DDH964 TaxID=1823759 RepID=UPI00078CBB99|nr:hypothetical protein [Desulfuromonas sp. DDH964]AMV70780.1 hypothetical protein DBW_0378 [Desulfuromonas sp. DDH964]
MSKSLKFLLWALVFFGLLLATDQLLLRVPMEQPALASVRSFYLDFRGRLLRLAGHAPPATIDQLIDQAVQHPAPVTPPARPATTSQPAAPAQGKPEAAATPRYLWVDAAGDLQFADRREDIPERYRGEARPLER